MRTEEALADMEDSFPHEKRASPGAVGRTASSGTPPRFGNSGGRQFALGRLPCAGIRKAPRPESPLDPVGSGRSGDVGGLFGGGNGQGALLDPAARVGGAVPALQGNRVDLLPFLFVEQ